LNIAADFSAGCCRLRHQTKSALLRNSVNTGFSLRKSLILQQFIAYQTSLDPVLIGQNGVCIQWEMPFSYLFYAQMNGPDRLWKSYFDKNLCKPTGLGTQDAMNFGRTIKIQYSFASCEALQRGFL
jgi:hypothetical protein